MMLGRSVCREKSTVFLAFDFFASRVTTGLPHLSGAHVID
jgi:hypothetical protein